MSSKKVLSKRQIYRRIAQSYRLQNGRIPCQQHFDIQCELNTDQRVIQLHTTDTETVNMSTPDDCNGHLQSSIDHLESFANLTPLSFSTNNTEILIHDTTTMVPNAKDDPQDLQSFLRSWSLQYNISHVALSSLLKFLKLQFPEVPSDARTLMNTSNKSNILILGNGEFLYFGFKTLLQSILPIAFQNAVNEIKLSFNIDGLPIFNSSNTQFWPILADVYGFTDSVFAIGIFCGNSKPSPLANYLKPFVKELKDLMQSGTYYNGKLFTVSVRCFVCDMPARSYLKCVKSHNGYSSCDKCICNGNYIEHRVVLDDLDSALRTDESFQLQSDEDHHLGISPLIELNIGLVTCFPTDYMHSVCLGVMRKLIHSWVKPTKGDVKHVKLDSRSTKSLNDRLNHVRKFIPVEFNRKPRGVNEIDHWKATEYRTFLLYVGPIVLFKILKKNVYDHFMLLHSAIYILVSKNLTSRFSNYSRIVLKQFVERCITIYGRQYLIYNVHSLIHMVDDVERFGTLDTFAAFKFENYLGSLKKTLRSPYKPLQQVGNRLSEKDNRPMLLDNVISYNCIKQEHLDGPVPPQYVGKQFRNLTWGECNFICNSRADSYCMIQNKTVIFIENILNIAGNIMLYGKAFKKYEDFYKKPCPSSNFNIFLVDELSQCFCIIPVKEIYCKCVCIPFYKKMVILPLAHM
jgi:hypothetical protein